MTKATFNVDKRTMFFLIFFAGCVFSLFFSQWVQTNGDITTYLPPETETRQGLTLMEDRFTTFTTGRVMVGHIDLDTALDALRVGAFCVPSQTTIAIAGSFPAVTPHIPQDLLDLTQDCLTFPMLLQIVSGILTYVALGITMIDLLKVITTRSQKA